MKKVAIIGGGAAGFFLGANLNPSLEVHIFEKAKAPLQKVKISGGGRCNLTHACFEPKILSEFYPRGGRELISVFSKFQPGDTLAWFEERGIALKIQDDGRVFPVSNNAMDIVETLIKENQRRGTLVHLEESVKALKTHTDCFSIETTNGQYSFDFVAITTGSSSQMWQLINHLGHTIIKPVPSLFTFRCNDSIIKGLQGTTFKNALVEIEDTSLTNQGDLLITHWGFSGPAILVLSAWGARILNEKAYSFKIKINFIHQPYEQAFNTLKIYKESHTKNTIGNTHPFEITKRFWFAILENLNINEKKKYSEIKYKDLREIAHILTQSVFNISGKSTFKDEFVTAGGVNLKEINFRNMESKRIANLFFAGETLDIDAITGGFNFQACWSEAYLIACYLNSQGH